MLRSCLPRAQTASSFTARGVEKVNTRLHRYGLDPVRRLHVDRDGASPSITGGIEIIAGPMFAGKSSELLRRVAVYEAAGLAVAVVKSSRDNRYSDSHVVTHDGIKRPCYSVPSLAAFREAAGQRWAGYQVIAVDEAQFFPDLLDTCTVSADLEGKRWLVAGLDGDFLRRKFGQVLDLVPHAEAVTKLTARCQYCPQAGASPAPFTIRLVASDGRQEVVGGAERYAAVCRHHYVTLTQQQAQRDEAREEHAGGTATA